MKISFIAGFGPISANPDASATFYSDALGIEMEEDEGYRHTDKLPGARAFAIWPLTQAAEACFGSAEWPPEIPVPQAWIEFDVESPALAHQAAADLEARGYRLLRAVQEMPWGQTVGHLLSPEGLLAGIAYTPWMHTPDGGSGSAL